MKILKTIVATAAIVFALTTVAMAGVQHFTWQSGQADSAQAQTAQHAQRTQHHANAVRHQTHSHRVAGTTLAAWSGSGGMRRHATTHHASSSTSNAGSHAETGHHSGGGHDGGSCGD
jgi:hypothetical protein